MTLTPEQIQIRDAVRTYAQERIAPQAAQWDRDHTFPAQVLKELGELGVMGMTVPETWGGAGLDTLSLALAKKGGMAGTG